MKARSVLVLAAALCILPQTVQAAPQTSETTVPEAIAQVPAVPVAITPVAMLPSDAASSPGLTAEVSSSEPIVASTATDLSEPLSLRPNHVGPLRSALYGPGVSGSDAGGDLQQSVMAYRRETHILRVTTLALVLGIVVLVLLI